MVPLRREEDEVARLRGAGDGQTGELFAAVARDGYALFLVEVMHQAGTVKAFGRGATPDVRRAYEFFCRG